MDGNTIVLQWEEPRITNGPMADYEIFYTDSPERPDAEWMVKKSGGPERKGPLTLTDLKEMTDYTVKIRGLNQNGPGLFVLPFTVCPFAFSIVCMSRGKIMQDRSLSLSFCV